MYIRLSVLGITLRFSVCVSRSGTGGRRVQAIPSSAQPVEMYEKRIVTEMPSWTGTSSVTTASSTPRDVLYLYPTVNQEKEFRQAKARYGLLA